MFKVSKKTIKNLFPRSIATFSFILEFFSIQITFLKDVTFLNSLGLPRVLFSPTSSVLALSGILQYINNVCMNNFVNNLDNHMKFYHILTNYFQIHQLISVRSMYEYLPEKLLSIILDQLQEKSTHWHNHLKQLDLTQNFHLIFIFINFYLLFIPDYFVWLKYISWFFYVNEACNVFIWRDVTNIECTQTAENDVCSGAGCYTTGKQFLDQYNFKEIYCFFDSEI
ncbi:white [Brachionus plicatilis]|uniref:White n=1 Tax=Brachionus plicatilis TaxID=10195 RepID=A0A3M7SA56_BRAPC|nr:white [Brachionus plicatilis]